MTYTLLIKEQWSHTEVTSLCATLFVLGCLYERDSCLKKLKLLKLLILIAERLDLHSGHWQHLCHQQGCSSKVRTWLW